MNNVVFFIQNISLPAGSERVTSIIASELSKRGNNVTILSICGNNTCYYELDTKVKIHTLFLQNSLDNRKQFFSVIKKLDQFYSENKVDVVIDIFAALSIYTLALKIKYHYKNISWEHFNYKINTGMNKIGRKLAVLFSNQIVTLTDRDKEYYIKNNPKHRAKIDFIYNPTPFQHVKELNYTEREKIVISVGRLNWQKGFDRLINVWSKINKQTDWKLYILGDGEEREKLQQMIKNAGIDNLVLMGAVKNIEQYYQSASIYISTARFEGLPMTMIEAQSYGLPIISFDYDTGPSEIIADEKNGYLITGSNELEIEDKMCDRLMYLMNDIELRKEFSKNAFLQSKRFKSDSIVKKWIQILDEI